ncbi:sulfotransferase [Thalassotalea sediminis]|uniref:sulfotransferase n=1 Tax=Thalassotalea sediminis TaxID=1759089 RepID=UPI00257454A6|nr:sulfotransferase [Thalassotalea sediminis]
MNSFDKVFIIGLPRTGTTSICKKCLELGFKVAHTAYTENTFTQAQVIADTPIFNDFIALDHAYPNSKFILLERELEQWVPSIRQLLLRMHKNVVREDGGFNPIIKRCYQAIFSPFSLDNINDDAFLINAYQEHHKRVLAHFAQQPEKLLYLALTDTDALRKLTTFLDTEEASTPFEVLNRGGKVTAWKDIENSNKIASTNNGRATPLPYKF